MVCRTKPIFAKVQKPAFTWPGLYTVCLFSLILLSTSFIDWPSFAFCNVLVVGVYHLLCSNLLIELKYLSQGEHLDDEESFFDLLSRFQSKRMDDQRCSLTVAENKENTNSVPKSNHNNNAAASMKPMMPLNNSNAANSKTCSNGTNCRCQNL